jgi:hypothetical protein
MAVKELTIYPVGIIINHKQERIYKMSKLIDRNGIAVESEIKEISDSQMKQYKFGHERHCGIYKDITRQCYVHTIIDISDKTHYILNESKKLSDLSTFINRENDNVFINVTLSNCENDQVFYAGYGENCPERRMLEVGTITNMGIILAKTANSDWYYIKHENEKYSHDGVKKTGTHSYMTCHWHHVFDISKYSKERMSFKDSCVRYFNTIVESLYGKEWHNGVDRNPFYQRGDVWTLEQKVALIDSIFNEIPIGAMILAKRDFGYTEDGKIAIAEEIIDGKQRFTTIIDFVCDKFPYNGLYYSELHPHDRNRFDNSQVMIGEMNFRYFDGKYNEKEVLETFVRLNIGGTSMNPEVIEAAKDRLKEIKEK